MQLLEGTPGVTQLSILMEGHTPQAHTSHQRGPAGDGTTQEELGKSGF